MAHKCIKWEAALLKRWNSIVEVTTEAQTHTQTQTVCCPKPMQACCCWHFHQPPLIQLPCSRLPVNSPKKSLAHSYPPFPLGGRQSPTAWGGRVRMKLILYVQKQFSRNANTAKCACLWSEWKSCVWLSTYIQTGDKLKENITCWVNMFHQNSFSLSWHWFDNSLNSTGEMNWKITSGIWHFDGGGEL